MIAREGADLQVCSKQNFCTGLGSVQNLVLYLHGKSELSQTILLLRVGSSCSLVIVMLVYLLPLLYDLITCQQAKGIMHGILNGVKTIHEAGIVHNDLHVRNVMMKANTPKVADFGVCRHAGSRQPQERTKRIK